MRSAFRCFAAMASQAAVDFRGELVMKSPPTLRRGFNGFCATTISGKFGIGLIWPRIGSQSRAREEAVFCLFCSGFRFLTGAALRPHFEPCPNSSSAEAAKPLGQAQGRFIHSLGATPSIRRSPSQHRRECRSVGIAAPDSGTSAACDRCRKDAATSLACHAHAPGLE